jgi:hypothetical protein
MKMRYPAQEARIDSKGFTPILRAVSVKTVAQGRRQLLANHVTAERIREVGADWPEVLASSQSQKHRPDPTPGPQPTIRTDRRFQQAVRGRRQSNF